MAPKAKARLLTPPSPPLGEEREKMPSRPHYLWPKFFVQLKFPLVIAEIHGTLTVLFMKTAIHPKYVDAEIRCACGNVIKTRSTRSTIIVGICNVCHPFYTGQQKFVDTAGRVDKFQQRLAKTQAAQAEHATKKKKKV
jgi:large subunit ribosomal protein L31